jgi:hypothetical protein
MSQSSGSLGSLVATIYDQYTQAYEATGLSTSTTYYITVRTYNTAGQYADSSQLSGKTSPSPVTPVSLNYPYSSDVTDTSVMLTWSIAQYNPDFQKYDIFMSQIYGSLGDFIGTVGDQYTSSYLVTGLQPGTTYYFTVRTVTQQANAADSYQMDVTTSPSVFSLPLISIMGISVLIITVFAVAAYRHIKRGPQIHKKIKPTWQPPIPPVRLVRCEVCGNEVSNVFKFCGKCGARVPEDDETRIY